MVEPEIEDILDRIAEEVEATITPGFNAPDVVRIIQPQMTHPGFVSRLSLPENIESVQDEVFRQFADEMKTQYELLEADYNEIKHSNRKIKDEMVYRNYLARETQTNFEILIKKLCKVIARDNPQYNFGETIIDKRHNIQLPVFNSNTKRFTNYSNNTRSFLDIFRK
tara:strand:+ start:3220 stop:3720 length:501 start_codon:yes stop_codon:yes gene_type:complete